MNRTALERFEDGLRCILPLLITAGFVILFALPTGLPDFFAVKPMVALAAIYYWAIYRPDLLPYTVSFAIGLLYDVLVGTPLGLTSLVLLPLHAVAVSQRRFFVKKSFLVGWWGFAMLAPPAIVLNWLLASTYFGRFTTIQPMLFQTLLTIASYPLFAWLFGQVERLLPRNA
tara:strand:- start:1642 stop:2157 length:516 start_codon:yes stop_codon:yes gene_type:complete